MDKLALSFAEQSALRSVSDCTDLEALKELTSSLIRGHFQSRAFICTLLEQNLPKSDSFKNT